MNKEQLFINTVDSIYGLALTDGGWDSNLSSISKLLGSVCVSFEVINKRKQSHALFRIEGEVNRNMEKISALLFINFSSS